MPVVGGYLAFIGFYCMEAGLSLMSGEEVSGVQDWHRLFHRDAMILVVPGVLLGIALVLITTRFRHFAVLPLCLLAIPVGFHLVLLAADVSLAEARVSLDKGWLAPATNATDFWLVWDHFEVKKVDWGVLPSLIPTWLAMFFVVAFSSSLDVAAIQMELGGRVLDFNHELMTVGLSNLISGCTGGFTGSYIFSQTLLSMRAGIRSRVVGVIVIILELAVFMLPFSILAYIPKFFFGAVLTFIAIDLVYGWLFLSYKLVVSVRMCGMRKCCVACSFVAEKDVWSTELVAVLFAGLVQKRESVKKRRQALFSLVGQWIDRSSQGAGRGQKPYYLNEQ